MVTENFGYDFDICSRIDSVIVICIKWIKYGNLINLIFLCERLKATHSNDFFNNLSTIEMNIQSGILRNKVFLFLITMLMRIRRTDFDFGLIIKEMVRERSFEIENVDKHKCFCLFHRTKIYYCFYERN